MLFSHQLHQLLQPAQPVKARIVLPSNPRLEAYKAKQRQQRERGYGRRAMRANVSLWSFVMRLLRALLSALWAKLPTAPQPEPADHEWPAGEYVSIAARWAGKPI